MDNITCTLCGSKQFYEEIGFYYCQECQTQSQDVRQHVISRQENEEELRTVTASTKRIKKKKAPETKTEDLLTSWESYNYILLGLVNELIDLGANSQLKNVCKVLWFKYLHKLQVIGHGADFVPKLSACYSSRDALIIYGRQSKPKVRKKRRKKQSGASSSISDVSSLNLSLLKIERRKKRRELVLSKYNEDLDKDPEQVLSLDTVKNTEINSAQDEERFLKFTPSARKAILNKIPKHQLKTIIRDTENQFKRKKLSHSDLSSVYTRGPEVLSRLKIFGLIYLSLLIVKDKIQLGDILRFIREGKLSFHNVQHFFPEDYRDNTTNYDFWSINHPLPTHAGLRRVAGEIAKFLRIKRHISIPDLDSLCDRYCSELNLPGEIATLCKTFIGKTLPRMHMSQDCYIIPNYEGRSMAIIIFILKLLFGLDGVTEYSLSQFAEKINKFNASNKMFEWKEWEFYIQYRRAVIARHHFPTHYLNDDFDVPHIYAQFLHAQRATLDVEKKIRTAEIIEDLLKEFNSFDETIDAHLQFPVTLTPFRDYTDYLSSLSNSDILQNNYMTNLLRVDFKKASLKCTIFPYLFFRKNMNKLKIEHKGANDDIRFIEVSTMWARHLKFRRNVDKQVHVTIGETSIEKVFVPEHLEIVQYYTRQMDNTQVKQLIKCEKNLKKMKTFSENLTKKKWKGVFKDEDQYIHYNAYERYWLNNHDTSQNTKEKIDDILERFSYSLRLLMSESARTVEQNLKDIYTELNNVELHICYCMNFSKNKNDRAQVADVKIKKLIKNVESFW